MKTIINLSFLIFFSLSSYCQDDSKNGLFKKTAEGESTVLDHFSFVVGGGPSAFLGKLYLNPVVSSDSGNVVIIQRAPKAVGSLVTGLMYTPYVHVVTTPKGTEIYPRGICFTLLIAPLSFSKLGVSNITQSIDVGLGIGIRGRKCAGLLSASIYSVRQPYDYFIDKYKGNNLSYKDVSGNVQTSFDPSDNRIFYNCPVFTLGISLVFDLDIVAKYKSQSSGQTEPKPEASTIPPKTQPQTPAPPAGAPQK